MVWKF